MTIFCQKHRSNSSDLLVIGYYTVSDLSDSLLGKLPIKILLPENFNAPKLTPKKFKGYEFLRFNDVQHSENDFRGPWQKNVSSFWYC